MASYFDSGKQPCCGSASNPGHGWQSRPSFNQDTYPGYGPKMEPPYGFTMQQPTNGLERQPIYGTGSRPVHSSAVNPNYGRYMQSGYGAEMQQQQRQELEAPPRYEPYVPPVNGIVQPIVEPPAHRPGRCTNVMEDLKRMLNNLLKSGCSYYFRQPVNAILLNIPDYHKVIKRPMDLTTIKKRLQNNYYWQASEALEDFELIFDNCRLYNNEGTVVALAGKELRHIFQKKLKKLDLGNEMELMPQQPHSRKRRAEELPQVTAAAYNRQLEQQAWAEQEALKAYSRQEQQEQAQQQEQPLWQQSGVWKAQEQGSQQEQLMVQKTSKKRKQKKKDIWQQQSMQQEQDQEQHMGQEPKMPQEQGILQQQDQYMCLQQSMGNSLIMQRKKNNKKTGKWQKLDTWQEQNMQLEQGNQLYQEMYLEQSIQQEQDPWQGPVMQQGVVLQKEQGMDSFEFQPQPQSQPDESDSEPESEQLSKVEELLQTSNELRKRNDYLIEKMHCKQLLKCLTKRKRCAINWPFNSADIWPIYGKNPKYDYSELSKLDWQILENNLKANAYETFDDFVRVLTQMFENALYCFQFDKFLVESVNELNDVVEDRLDEYRDSIDLMKTDTDKLRSEKLKQLRVSLYDD